MRVSEFAANAGDRRSFAPALGGALLLHALAGAAAIAGIGIPDPGEQAAVVRISVITAEPPPRPEPPASGTPQSAIAHPAALALSDEAPPATASDAARSFQPESPNLSDGFSEILTGLDGGRFAIAPPRPAETGTRAALATLAACHEPDGTRRADCFALAAARPPADRLVADGFEDARFAFGPAFAGLSLAEARAALVGQPGFLDGPPAPLATAIDHRLSSISSLRDSLPPTVPDPAFGD